MIKTVVNPSESDTYPSQSRTFSEHSGVKIFQTQKAPKFFDIKTKYLGIRKFLLTPAFPAPRKNAASESAKERSGWGVLLAPLRLGCGEIRAHFFVFGGKPRTLKLKRDDTFDLFMDEVNNAWLSTPIDGKKAMQACLLSPLSKMRYSMER